MAKTDPRHRCTASVVARPVAAARATTCSGGLSTGTEWVMHRATSRRWELADEVGRCRGEDSVWRGGGPSWRWWSGERWWPTSSPTTPGGMRWRLGATGFNRRWRIDRSHHGGENSGAIAAQKQCGRPINGTDELLEWVVGQLPHAQIRGDAVWRRSCHAGAVLAF
jgi:hypothetical protein